MPDQSFPTGYDHRGDILAYGILCLVALVILLVFGIIILGAKVDPVELTLLTLVVGAPITALGVVTGFQFGSSKGSQMKDIALAQTPLAAPEQPGVAADPSPVAPSPTVPVKGT